MSHHILQTSADVIESSYFYCLVSLFFIHKQNDLHPAVIKLCFVHCTQYDNLHAL